MTKLELAFNTAVKAHAGEKRKAGNLFIFHPIETAIILQSYGFNEDVVIAGLLHDTVEHKKLDIKQIEKKFGAKISSMISNCTAPDIDDWKQSKLRYLRQMRGAPLETKATACADKISNLKETYRYLQTDGDKIWDIFRTGRQGQKWFHQELLEILKIDHPIQEELKYWIEKLFC